VKFQFSRSEKYLDSLHIAGLFSAAAFLLARFFPFDHFNVPLCAFRSMTGLPCPTCGMTTCFIAMAHGRFLDAFQISPMGSVIFVLALISVLYLIGTKVFHLPTIKVRFSRWEKIVLGISIFLVATANWIYSILTFP